MRFAAKHILISILSFLILFCVSYIPAHAQTIPDSNTNMHTYTQNVFIDVMGGLGCLLAGIDITNPHQPCVTNSTNSGSPTTYNVRNSGLIGTFASLTGALYTPPIHTIDYISDLTSHFGIVQHAYAQGVGFTSLNPLETIWKVFRNIAYLFFVVIFVLVGFGIMFRFNIDPRTVMSIENQLPKLIIGLILVTFSFAIAGLLIDVMWVLTFFVINTLTGIDCQLVKCTGDLTGAVTSNVFQNPFGFFNTIAPNGFLGVAAGVGGSTGDVIRGLFTQGNSNQLGLVPPLNGDNNCGNTPFICGLQDVMTGVVLNSLGSILAALLSYVISVLGILIVIVTLLIAMFRVWFSLILAYGYIIINIILAPVYILIGMIPGSKVSFTSWLKDMMANLFAFPTVIALLLLGRLVMDAFTVNAGTGGINPQALFVPPLIGNPNGNSGGLNTLGFIFGFFSMLAAPSAVNLMKGMFQVEPGKLGGQIFGGLAMGSKTFGGFARNVFGTLASNDIRYEEGANGATTHVIQGTSQKALNQVKKMFGGR